MSKSQRRDSGISEIEKDTATTAGTETPRLAISNEAVEHSARTVKARRVSVPHRIRNACLAFKGPRGKREARS